MISYPVAFSFETRTPERERGTVGRERERQQGGPGCRRVDSEAGVTGGFSWRTEREFTECS